LHSETRDHGAICPTFYAVDGRTATVRNNEIPFGGLFTGAEGRKTAEQQAIYGGTVGEQYDPCYHQACDTFDNSSDEVLDLNADAIAFATLTYAMDTSSVTGGAAAA
jgi:hypothetical protein